MGMWWPNIRQLIPIENQLIFEAAKNCCEIKLTKNSRRIPHPAKVVVWGSGSLIFLSLDLSLSADGWTLAICRCRDCTCAGRLCFQLRRHSLAKQINTYDFTLNTFSEFSHLDTKITATTCNFFLFLQIFTFSEINLQHSLVFGSFWFLPWN